MKSDCRIKRALISVWDKTGIVEFARTLCDDFGVELISTGGTARALQEAGLAVTMVEEVTGFPEMMDGRVKTLHPKIHGALLADRGNAEHMRQLAEQGIEPIDLVVVNLYPFERTTSRPDCTFAEAIEMIDIGGPCLLRAAAKNHQHVIVISDPRQFEPVLELLRASVQAGSDNNCGNSPDSGTCAWDALRRDLARAAFQQVCAYNAAITAYLRANDEPPGAFHALLFDGWSKPRYGENPHQQAEVLTSEALRSAASPHLFQTRPGKDTAASVELSYNNYADASAALELCAELTREAPSKPETAQEDAKARVCHIHDQRHTGRLAMPLPSQLSSPVVCCFIKHTNACGAAVDDDPVEAYRRAYLGDPNAAMGGILAVNFCVSAEFATAVMETYQRWGKPLRESGAPYAPGAFFVEVWIAPAFDADAVKLIRGELEGGPQKAWGQRVRLIEAGDMRLEPDAGEKEFKRIAGGALLQGRDLVGLNEDDWQVVTKRQPSEQEMNDLRLAWLVCKHTKSNAITVCKNGTLLGNGAGQMSRVMSCRIATWLAKENGHEADLAGSVAASDAFFPFRDGPDILADAGVTALIQPGGSKRDADTIAACDERGLAMIFTGTRHFKH